MPSNVKSNNKTKKIKDQRVSSERNSILNTFYKCIVFLTHGQNEEPNTGSICLFCGAWVPLEDNLFNPAISYLLFSALPPSCGYRGEHVQI